VCLTLSACDAVTSCFRQSQNDLQYWCATPTRASNLFGLSLRQLTWCSQQLVQFAFVHQAHVWGTCTEAGRMLPLRACLHSEQRQEPICQQTWPVSWEVGTPSAGALLSLAACTRTLQHIPSSECHMIVRSVPEDRFSFPDGSKSHARCGVDVIETIVNVMSFQPCRALPGLYRCGGLCTELLAVGSQCGGGVAMSEKWFLLSSAVVPRLTGHLSPLHLRLD
jgi:hypothetical protein